MHASSWTAHGRITGRLPRSAAGKAASVNSTSSAQRQNFESGSCEVCTRRLVGDEKLHHHFLGRDGTRAPGLDLHADGRRAHAGGREHAFALDLDHAGAAIAIGAIVGLRRVAEMRDRGPGAWHLPDGLVVMASTCSPSSSNWIFVIPPFFGTRPGNI